MNVPESKIIRRFLQIPVKRLQKKKRVKVMKYMYYMYAYKHIFKKRAFDFFFFSDFTLM